MPDVTWGLAIAAAFIVYRLYRLGRRIYRDHRRRTEP